MNFIWPSLLLLLLLVPLLIGAYVWLLKRRKKLAVSYANLALVNWRLLETHAISCVGFLIGATFIFILPTLRHSTRRER